MSNPLPWRLDPFVEQQRNWARMLNVPKLAGIARQTRVGTTPCDVVLEQGTHRLLRYRRETPATYAEPVLFCYALVNRSYILDLQPNRSVVQKYLERGFDVYMIDWGAPGPEDRGFDLDHYVLGFLAKSIEHVLGEHERESLHVLGYCMGGTMSALFAALRPALVKTLTLLAAPIDFSGRQSLLNVWAGRLDVDGFVSAHGNCPAWFLQACFLHMKPIQSFVEKPLSFYENMDDLKFLSSHFAMETWINDNVPVAGETFRTFVRDLYQGNQLVRGTFRLGGVPVSLADIECPLLLLTAKNDHLVPPGATEGCRGHVGSTDIESITVDAGHVGLVVGGKALRTLWPDATAWLANRSTSVPAQQSQVVNAE